MNNSLKLPTRFGQESILSSPLLSKFLGGKWIKIKGQKKTFVASPRQNAIHARNRRKVTVKIQRKPPLQILPLIPTFFLKKNAVIILTVKVFRTIECYHPCLHKNSYLCCIFLVFPTMQSPAQHLNQINVIKFISLHLFVI